MGEPNAAYYDKGSTETAQMTALTLKKLEQRRKLTGDSERLVIVLVGLPGRGKSFIARKLHHFLTWRGSSCRVFNVGKYRRQANAEMSRSRSNSVVSENNPAVENEQRVDLGSCDAKFFDPKNSEAAALRERVAAIALEDMLRWLDCETLLDHGSGNGNSDLSYQRNDSSHSSDSGWGVSRRQNRVAIYDATNSTKARRDWVLQECTDPVKRAGKMTGVVFVESLCDDQELLDQNFRFKVQNSPDFKGMSEEEAIADLRSRVDKYESQYETIADDTCSYIKIYNLSSKLMVNHIYGRMAKVIVPALMAWNIGTRPVFICRSGKTNDDDGNIMENAGNRKVCLRGDVLGHTGMRFRDALADYIFSEGIRFMRRRENVVSLETGTSISGLRKSHSSGELNRLDAEIESAGLPFPAHVMSSTMPRAMQTATWERIPFPVLQMSNLNPLDKGDFTGMELEEIKELDPEWYEKLEGDPFRTRFTGGESYDDLIHRLESCIIDIEQQVAPVVVVSHVSVIQALLAYFQHLPVESCTSIEVPMHTVFKCTPTSGGAWNVEKVTLIDDGSDSDEVSTFSDEAAYSTPIWGDKSPTFQKEVNPIVKQLNL